MRPNEGISRPLVEEAKCSMRKSEEGFSWFSKVTEHKVNIKMWGLYLHNKNKPTEYGIQTTTPLARTENLHIGTHQTKELIQLWTQSDRKEKSTLEATQDDIETCITHERTHLVLGKFVSSQSFTELMQSLKYCNDILPAWKTDHKQRKRQKKEPCGDTLVPSFKG